MIAIHEDATSVAAAAAGIVADFVAANPATTVALAGGTTPAATYEWLAEMPVDWGDVTLWLGDERWVSADHPDSNAGMVHRTLGAAARRLITPDCGIGDPHEAAAAYAATLRERFASQDGRPGLVLLGMGDDGHTASLFPGSSALAERDRSYVATWVEEKQTWRLTATLPLLWSARKIVFLVTGAAKAAMVGRVLETEAPLPSRLVAAGAHDVDWLLDAAAAAQLHDGP